MSGLCAAGGVCGFDPAGSACDDAVFCNGNDTCNASGTCANHSGDPCLPLNTNNADCSESCDEAAPQRARGDG